MTNGDSHIVDNFGRVHDYLRISLTERCNLRCFYCMPEEGVQLRDKEVFMTAEETIEIAKSFVAMGVKKIRLTGGEPLIKRNAEIIIRELGKLPIELTLTTNAVIVDRYIEVMKEAGIRSLNVSLDSLKAEAFNAISRRSYFDKIMANIDLLIENGFSVKINVVLIRDVNDREIIDFIEWGSKKNIDVRFIEFMPFDGNQWNWEKKVAMAEILRIVKSHYGSDGFTALPGGPNDTSKNFQLKGGKGSFGIISTVTNPFCDTCNRIRLTADGKLKNCLFSENETDLLTTLRNGLPIASLVRSSIRAKHKALGGHEPFNNENVDAIKNRSMITIGG